MPVTASGNVPAACFGPTRKISNAVPDLLIEAGRKAPTTLDGNPATVRFTRPENPFIAETFTVKIPMAAGFTVRVDGDAVIAKSGIGAVTMRLTLAE
jgi:hypothetical protein